MSAARTSFFGLDLLDNRFPVLHGLRVLGILSVVQFHVTWIFMGEQGIPIDNDFAAASLTVFFGMDLFFMLSGFLIGMILLRSLELSGTQNIKRFYVRRIFRTFPSYYLVLAFLALATHISVEQKAHLPYEVVYLTNFVPLGRDHVIMFWGWSLALEEQFYLTVPLLFYLLFKLPSDRARLALLFAMWASALVVRMAIFQRYAPWDDFILYGALYFKTYTRFDTLIAGIALAFVHLRHREKVSAFLSVPLHRALVALPSLACLWMLLRPTMFGVENVQTFHVFAWGSVTTVMYFGALLLFLSSDGIFVRFLSHPFFRKVATLGYGIYLVHIPILDHGIVPIAKAMDRRHVPMYVTWPVTFVILMIASVVVAYLLHLFVEKPTLRLREKLAA